MSSAIFVLIAPEKAKGRVFFFEKKNQKTFVILGARWGWRVPQGAKVFCFFFAKKKPSFLARLAPGRMVPRLRARPSPW
jgi:hypothetical protein